MISMSPSTIVSKLSNHYDAMVLDWADELKKVFILVVEEIVTVFL